MEIALSRDVVCTAPLPVVWRVVADTDRLNQAMGLERVTKVPLSTAGAARYLVSTKVAGFNVEYEEYPFEWVEFERIAVKRVMRSGFVSSYRLVMAVAAAGEPVGDQTRVTCQLSVVPQRAWTAPLIRAQARATLTKLTVAIARLASTDVARLAPGVSPRPTSRALQRAEERLVGSLAADEAALARRLVAHVRDAGDAELVRIRPFELAESWSADRRQVVSICLAAVPAGLLELSWDLICPSCRVATGGHTHLDEIADHGNCQLCDIGFGVDFDRSIEVSFRPVPAARFVDEAPFCISGAARTPHVVAQALLPARGEAVVAMPLVPGRYRLFLRGGAVASVEVAEGAHGEAGVTAADAFTPATLQLAPRGLLRVASVSTDDRHIKLERLEWASQAASAQYVSTLPSFRRLFSGETLKTGVALRVSKMAILFSDLMGSTALYTRVGDAAAYKVVTDHFRLLARAAEAHGGTIVKTIGDAVMAVFRDEKDAVRAALAMQTEFANFRARTDHASSTALRLGIFAGPCYAVTANRMIDYFGQSVNLAARLESQAGPDEVVLSAEIADRAETEGWLTGARVSERIDAKLKGIEGRTRAARVKLA